MAETSELKLDPMWYEGKAEISVFELQQNRYNETHSGEAVMIFVTEDFLSDKQVKNDTYTSENSIPILKNNQIRRFTTGVYDYSIFTSVFTSVGNLKKPNTLKITTSSQDWCGQSFMQLNAKKDKFEIHQYSYFENEGDKKFKIEKTLSFDEVFNQIRINPRLLPEGSFQFLPSTIFLRLKHKASQAYQANGIFKSAPSDLSNNENLKEYIIEVPSLDLKYTIIYRDENPFEIIEWRESYPSTFDGKIRTTIAKRKSIEWIDYWNKNSTNDALLRDKLKLNRLN